MTRVSWDSDESLQTSESLKPLWSIDYKKKDELLEWTNTTFSLCYDRDSDAIAEYLDNCSRYRGRYPSTEPRVGDKALLARKQSRFEGCLVINHTQDLTEQKVSAVSKFKPNTNVVPQSVDTQDEREAIVAEELLYSIKYDNDLDSKYARLYRRTFLGGEAYIFPFWNQFKGPEHPDWKKMRGKKIPLVDKNGEKILDVDGKEILITQPQYVGDIDFRVRSVENVRLFGPMTSEADIYGVIEHDWVHVEELKKDYPDVDFEADKKASAFKAPTLMSEGPHDHILVMRVTHRSHRHLPDGLYWSCTPSIILDKPRANPHKRITGSDWDNLPCRRLTDVDQEGTIRGFPSNSNIGPLQNIFDKLTTLCVKNIFWGSHLKWFATQNSVDKTELTNDSTIVWVKPGQAPPTAQTFQAFGADVFNFRSSLVTDMEKIYGIYSVSRGSPPAGTRATGQLYFYDEQEQQRRANLQKKINKLVVDVDRMILSLVAEHYKDHDERLINILGETKRWLVKKFKIESLRRSFDVRIENSPNLPDSRYARLEYLKTVNKEFPGTISLSQVGDLIDLGVTDKFITPSRMATLAAEAENDAMSRGEEVKSPEVYEDQIAHWQSHVKDIQNPRFKDLPEEIQQMKKDHSLAHEMIMLEEIAPKSPAFAQMLAAIPQFPLFYEPSAPLMPPPPQGPGPQAPQGPLPPGKGDSQGLPNELLPPQMQQGNPQ